MLSCWPCFMGWVSKEGQSRLLQAGFHDLWELWQSLKNANNGQDPMPSVLAQELGDHAAVGW